MRNALNGNYTRDQQIIDTLKSNNLFNRSDIQWYSKFNRFGYVDPFNGVSNTKEYLFFTKPDLHIVEPGTGTLNPELSGSSFFNELINIHPDIIEQLQQSSDIFGSGNANPFMPLLSNSVKTSLELPEISAEMTDTSATIYGTSIEYRRDGFNSDEKHDFSLEFEDTRYLEIYHFFKAYEEYQRIRNDGIITPPNIDNAPVDPDSGYAYSYYIRTGRLHDQYAIYKIVTDEDYETILYYALVQGVTSKTVPRDAFSDFKADGGLRYSVGFRGQFVKDMEPWILSNFNSTITNSGILSKEATFLPIYNAQKGRVDGDWATMPFIVREQVDKMGPGVWLGPSNTKYIYKLKWRIS